MAQRRYGVKYSVLGIPEGSVIATTDSSATATPYVYSATGEPKGGWSSSAPAFRYTGQVAIASAQIYYYKARMCDPALGRFLQTDPVGYQAG
jgi:RHS repeat-associated protein